MIYKTEKLIESVKRRTLAPTSQKTFQDADIIALLNEELELKIVPGILSVREDYFLAAKSSNIAANVELYPVPERCIGNALKNVFYVAANGTDKRDLPRLQLTDTIDFVSSSDVPYGYVLRGDYVQIPRPSQSNGAIEQWYLQRPSELIATTSCAKITGISTDLGITTFTVDTDLSGSLTVGDKIDFLRSVSPVGLTSIDVVISAITTSTFDVAESDVTDASGAVTAAINDFICPARKANIPMVPQEFHPLLAEMAAARIMQALGHLDKLSAINVSIGEMRQSAMKMVSNRVEDDGRAIVNRSGISSFINRNRRMF